MFSGLDIINTVNDSINIKPNVMRYGDLINYKKLEDIMPVVILYEIKQKLGHWVCVFEHNGYIEHFDSYGLKPDDELKYTNNHMRKILGMEIPYLTYLMMTSNKKIRYNHYRLQGEDTNTCGRWVSLRLIMNNLDEYEFSKIIKKISKIYNFNDMDDLVTYLT